jgi:hypothetical protein
MGWRGRSCSHWHPTEAENWDELSTAMAAIRKGPDHGEVRGR